MSEKETRVNIPERAVATDLEEFMSMGGLVTMNGGLGEVQVMDYMGNDMSIVEAARVSVGGENVAPQLSDHNLLRYLMRHRHTSPFEMCEIKFRVRCPMFVARQWVRHRTANWNEISARYSELPNEFYIPPAARFQYQSTDNKQGSGGQLDQNEASDMRLDFEKSADESRLLYDGLLEHGLAREVARNVLPVSQMTEFVWKMDLHNLLHFLKLRTHPHAQLEIRTFANAILSICELWVPATVSAWVEYQQHAFLFSSSALRALGELVNTIEFGLAMKRQGCSNREIRETIEAIRLDPETS